MRVEHANPFITAVRDLFLTMLDAEVHRGKVSLAFHRGTPCEVSALIRLSGKAHGTVLLSFPKETALKVAGRLASQKFERIGEEALDAIGEMANIVTGGAKALLDNYEMSISVPEVVQGIGCPIQFPSDCQPILIPFESDLGDFCLLVGLSYASPHATKQSRIDVSWASREDQRRGYSRLGLRQNIRVTFLPPEGSPRIVSAISLDISETAISIVHRGMVQSGVPCRLEIVGEDGRKLMIHGETQQSEYLNDMLHVITITFDKPIDLSRVFGNHEEVLET